MEEYNKCIDKEVSTETAQRLAGLPHGTIKRFSPITVAIVGASRRFLAQARTHQVGINYVSASLQYSDYSGKARFVVPYAIMKADADRVGNHNTGHYWRDMYLLSCANSMEYYNEIAKYVDNDTAGYAAPQGLRNILIIQANHESWATVINKRCCNRNTPETQYVLCRIWEELLKTEGGQDLFANVGPFCRFGKCREGSFSCGKPLTDIGPEDIIKLNWPLLAKGDINENN